MSRPHPWLPVSPCGAGCLPPADAVPTVTRTHRLLRLLAVGVTLLAGAVVLPLVGPAGQERALRAWHGALLRALQIRLEVTGGDRFGAAGVGVLVVSNHTSWLDLVALSAVQPLRMVAKREVRGWPMIGLLARRVGTVFVDRERLSTLPRTITTVSGALAPRRCGRPWCAAPECGAWWGRCTFCRCCPLPGPIAVRWRSAPRPSSPLP
jgi:hypothetical protein